MKDLALEEPDFLDGEEPELGQDSPEPGAGGSDKGDKGDKPDPQLTALQKRMEELEAKNSELAESERYWADRARRSGRVAEEPEPEPPPEPEPEDNPEKFAEDLASDGMKALYKRGIPSKAEVAKMIAAEVNKKVAAISREADLMRAYPELNDEKSEMFQRTAQVLKTDPIFAGDPEFQKSSKGLRTAARIAKAELAAEARSRGNDDEDDVERRIAAQGDRGGRRRVAESDDDDLGPQERQIITAMSRFGVTEEGFRKQRQQITRRGGR